AIRQYGHECWTHEVLESLATREEANEAEIKWIDRLNTLAPSGYHLHTGRAKTRHASVADKIRATRASKPIAWQEAQIALLRKAHAEWLSATSSEERREAARDAWRSILPEKRSEIA